MSSEFPPLRVLSLDGGGMRGTYTATYLDRVAASFAKRRNVGSLDIGAAFDLIVGTSTGGIIACALSSGIPSRTSWHSMSSTDRRFFPARYPRACSALRAISASVRRRLRRQRKASARR
jgi:patatin-like phospholipase/acyl hydrolase